MPLPHLCFRFEHSMSPTHGNCYVFNSIDSKTGSSYETQYLAQTGPLLGLSLVINLDQQDYINGGQTEQAGARLVIHPNAQS